MNNLLTKAHKKGFKIEWEWKKKIGQDINNLKLVCNEVWTQQINI